MIRLSSTSRLSHSIRSRVSDREDTAVGRSRTAVDLCFPNDLTRLTHYASLLCGRAASCQYRAEFVWSVFLHCIAHGRFASRLSRRSPSDVCRRLLFLVVRVCVPPGLVLW